jgi:two-component system response regulator DctR
VVQLRKVNKPKIVIIDDEPDILYTIKEICQYGGWEASTASNGKQGYELCRINKPNLAIVDYHMPDWDGLTTVKKIRQLDNAVSILVLTVDESQETAEKFIAAGATDFAIKPIKSPDLISRIKMNIQINEIQKKYIEEKHQVYIEKGMSPATLSIICSYFRERGGELTIDDVTNGLNLAYQTVHRYVQYMLEEKMLETIPIYGQIGRPKNKYKLL